MDVALHFCRLFRFRFFETTYKAPHLLNASNISNSTIKNALYYLQAITKRSQRDWQSYASIINNINALKDWEYCGVFENLNSSGIDVSYEPENNASDDSVFDARSKGDASWYKPKENDEVYNFFSNHSEYGAGVHYAQTFVISPKNQRIRLRLGKGGYTRIYLNDAIIHDSKNQFITELDAFTYEVNLQKGVNRILVKSVTNGTVPFFIIRLEDLTGSPLKDYTISFENRIYEQNSIADVDPIEIPNEFEVYFKNKLNKKNSDINLSKFCLFKVYLRTGKLSEAIELLKEWSKNYPNSSFIKSCLLECYNKTGDEDALKKLESNILRLDPEYYLSLMLEFENSDELFNLDIQEFNSKLNKMAELIDYPFMKPTTDFFISIRNNDRIEMREKLDVLLSDQTLPIGLKVAFSEFYSTFFNDDIATIDVLKNINSSQYDWEIIIYLAYYLNKNNKTEKAIELYLDSLEKFDYDNNILYNLVLLLHESGEFERSLPYIDQALNNFPNSYVFVKLKADALVQIGKKMEAIEFYNLALNRRPFEYQLRNIINDIEQKENPLNDFKLEEPYKYIQENRNSNIPNNYGVNVLLNQTTLMSYENGGGEYESYLIYEITSQNGIDIFKEHNLGISGDYSIYKSEIVKPNGEIIPSNRNGLDMVFDTLEIGDVIYINYQVNYTRNGRFYNDYILTHTFNGYHPTINNVYRLLTIDENVKYEITNGEVDYNITKKGDFYIHEWSKIETTSLPLSEDYMPPFNDVSTKLHVSSIDSWNEVAIWYSDLVRTQLKFDQEVKDVFNEIFPNGYLQLTETERAKNIYYYITNNLNYSHVSFKQEGFIPQKPSKTLKTKLGDCKDFSSLFLVLAQQADLNANLVLILTSDYGKNKLVLPSTDFNHCIVKVQLEGKDQYLELTSKYLPFKALPNSLVDATALEIPFDNTDKSKSDIFYLNPKNKIYGELNSDYVLKIDNDSANIHLKSNVKGNLAAYYVDTFKNQSGKQLNETIEQEIYDRASLSIQLINLESFDYNEANGEVNYSTILSADLTINKIGDVYTFNIPYFVNPYTSSIIKSENRSYPIDYKQYENAGLYTEKIHIKLDAGFQIIEVPNDINLKHKEHQFVLKYTLIQPNEVIIELVSKVNSENISASDYLEFKEFVEEFLDTRKTIIQYKATI